MFTPAAVVAVQRYSRGSCESMKGNGRFFCAYRRIAKPTSVQQGETIPCIAHAVAVENIIGR